MDTQKNEDANDERVTAKIKADDQFGLTLQGERSERAWFFCIVKPGENQIWKSECISEFVEWAATKNKEIVDGR